MLEDAIYHAKDELEPAICQTSILTTVLLSLLLFNFCFLLEIGNNNSFIVQNQSATKEVVPDEYQIYWLFTIQSCLIYFIFIVQIVEILN